MASAGSSFMVLREWHDRSEGRRGRPRYGYSMAIWIGLLTASGKTNVTVTRPFGTFSGMVTLIWYRPTYPGLSPASSGWTMVPPIPPPKFRVGMTGVCASISPPSPGDGAPVGTLGVVGPRPTAYRMMVSPILAGRTGTPGTEP